VESEKPCIMHFHLHMPLDSSSPTVNLYIILSHRHVKRIVLSYYCYLTHSVLCTWLLLVWWFTCEKLTNGLV